MQPNVNALERAFELASSGECRTVQDIRRRLQHEGYNGDMLTGRTLKRQLEALIKQVATGR